MMAAARWAREQKVPYLGICLGFQIAVIEWARNVCGLPGACTLQAGFLLTLTASDLCRGSFR